MIMPQREQFHSSVEQTCSDVAAAPDSAPEKSGGVPTLPGNDILPERVLTRNGIHASNEDENETEQTVTRSSIQREKSKRLTYPELGNPLVTIVQSLFQSLSAVISDALVKPRFTKLPEPVIV